MKFKTKEELIEFERDQHYYIVPYYKGWNDAVNESFKSFKERVEFYKKYKNRPEQVGAVEYRLKEQQPRIYEEWIEFEKKTYKEMRYSFLSSVEKWHYNNWLFNYCFGDI